MLRQITWRQFLEWAAYAQLEPFDARRGDYQAAMIAATMANINRDSKSKPQPYTTSDFLLRFDNEEEAQKEQSWQEQKRIGRMIAQAFGAGAKKKR